MKHHKSVRGVVGTEESFSAVSFFGGGFFGGLYVQLDGHAAAHWGGDMARDLALRFTHWEADPRLAGQR